MPRAARSSKLPYLDLKYPFHFFFFVFILNFNFHFHGAKKKCGGQEAKADTVVSKSLTRYEYLWSCERLLERQKQR